MKILGRIKLSNRGLFWIKILSCLETASLVAATERIDQSFGDMEESGLGRFRRGIKLTSVE